MKFSTKILLLGLLTITGLVITFLQSPIPQSTAYHAFADQTQFLGIANFLNVLTNLPFVAVGILGLRLLNRSGVKRPIAVIYGVLFTGILLIGFGSSYYHLDPNNSHLVWDRIPMTIVFMAFLTAVIAECISLQSGRLLLFPLVLVGIASVLWWNYTEETGRGDMRLYGFVQFYPMIVIPVILVLFPSPVNAKAWRSLMWVVIWYVFAKLFEHFDKEIYAATGFVSGHSLKHIAAAVATWYMVHAFAKKYGLRM
jgi:MFS family permease